MGATISTENRFIKSSLCINACTKETLHTCTQHKSMKYHHKINSMKALYFCTSSLRYSATSSEELSELGWIHRLILGPSLVEWHCQDGTVPGEKIFYEKMTAPHHFLNSNKFR